MVVAEYVFRCSDLQPVRQFSHLYVTSAPVKSLSLDVGTGTQQEASLQGGHRRMRGLHQSLPDAITGKSRINGDQLNITVVAQRSRIEYDEASYRAIVVRDQHLPIAEQTVESFALVVKRITIGLPHRVFQHKVGANWHIGRRRSTNQDHPSTHPLKLPPYRFREI